MRLRAYSFGLRRVLKEGKFRATWLGAHAVACLPQTAQKLHFVWGEGREGVRRGVQLASVLRPACALRTPRELQWYAPSSFRSNKFSCSLDTPKQSPYPYPICETRRKWNWPQARGGLHYSSPPSRPGRMECGHPPGNRRVP